MNPILRRTIENIEKHVSLTETEKIHVMFYIGKALQDVAFGASTNPNFNLKGGDSADENSDAKMPNILQEQLWENLKDAVDIYADNLDVKGCTALKECPEFNVSNINENIGWK